MSNFVQSNVVVAAAITGVAVGLAAFILYKISSHEVKEGKDGRNYKNGKEDRQHGVTRSSEERDGGKAPSRNSSTSEKRDSNGPSDVFTAEGFTVLKLNVPKDMVGAIIGRQGCNIKQIQAETKTKIDFSKQMEGEERTITIRGSEKGTQDAELGILHIVYGQRAKETKTLEVPRGSLGYIIGKGGETIQKIQSDSKCHIKVDSAHFDRNDPQAAAEVKLTGSSTEIIAAAAMIDECVEAWETKRNKSKLSTEHARKRPPGGHRPPPATILPGSPLVCENWPNHSDYVDCYVTASVNPTHIWLQLLSPNATKLEEINSQLSHLYTDPKQYVDDVVKKRPPIGTTVAARNPTDNLWFRGKISAYKDNEGEEPAVDIYFVDYGDSSWMPLENYNMQLLRPEFYILPAQAIECYTDAVLNPDCPKEWSEDHCDRFEKMTYTGQWTVLMGAVLSWKKKEDGSDQLPVVKLVDTNTDTDIHICDDIVKYATSYKAGFGEVSRFPYYALRSIRKHEEQVAEEARCNNPPTNSSGDQKTIDSAYADCGATADCEAATAAPLNKGNETSADAPPSKSNNIVNGADPVNGDRRGSQPVEEDDSDDELWD